MLKTLINIFRVPELRNKVLFTLLMLVIYRIGYHIPIPGVDQSALDNVMGGTEGGAFDRIASYVEIFSGGSLSQSTIFGLGIMPYISASIILQLLTTVVPSLERLKNEGEQGRRKIQEWTRYLTIPLCLIQAVFYLGYLSSHQPPLILEGFRNTLSFWVMGLTCMTAGCIFLMWLGEQIDEYGLGNGISLIILAGIVSRMPSAVITLIQQADLTLGGGGNPEKTMTLGKLVFLTCSFVFVVAGSILITQAQRRIPIQQAKHTRGRRVYGGQKQFLPLRVNHGGVMPIIFAQSLMLFPGFLFGWLNTITNPQGEAVSGIWGTTVNFLNIQFQPGMFINVMTEIVLIYFFAYFWTTIQFQPKEMANQLRDYGSFVIGLRPGKRTADYLEKVMMRITFVGAAFLALIAIIPTAVGAWLNIPLQITAFLGGTGLLIVVSVALDLVQRIEANLVMRNYGGFLSGSGKNKRMRS